MRSCINSVTAFFLVHYTPDQTSRISKANNAALFTSFVQGGNLNLVLFIHHKSSQMLVSTVAHRLRLSHKLEKLYLLFLHFFFFFLTNKCITHSSNEKIYIRDPFFFFLSPPCHFHQSKGELLISRHA